jgi:hypothetical protein
MIWERGVSRPLLSPSERAAETVVVPGVSF